MNFGDWLDRQVERPDDVGAFARHVKRDKLRPARNARLYIYLLRYDGSPIAREASKLAHREWRGLRLRDWMDASDVA